MITGEIGENTGIVPVMAGIVPMKAGSCSGYFERFKIYLIMFNNVLLFNYLN